MFARIYEKEGLKFGLVELALIWAISCLFSAFIAITVLIEQKWQLTQQLVYATLVRKRGRGTMAKCPFDWFLPGFHLQCSIGPGFALCHFGACVDNNNH
jgi:hypothetical protein